MVVPGINAMTPQPDIAQNLTAVRRNIDTLARRHHRDPGDINLLAVSKTKTIESIMTAAAAGQQHFGENYLQEALAKTTAGPDLTWHFIGAIQSNKTSQIAEHFDWVHTVASAKVAERLSRARSPNAEPLNVCVQVNVSNDPAKAGASPIEIEGLLETVASLPNLVLRGLMTLPTQSIGLIGQRAPFAHLRQIAEAARAHGLNQVRDLSMGMSGDLEAAVAEGATWVRIGTDIFGPRETAPRPRQ